jgi:hypothetical protein
MFESKNRESDCIESVPERQLPDGQSSMQSFFGEHKVLAAQGRWRY